MKSQYSIRFFQEDEAEEIVDLLQLVFDGWPKFDLDCTPLDHFNWKFIETQLQPVFLTAAVSDNKIIGISSNVFQNLKIGKKTCFAAKGTDMAVHPAYRKRGVARNTMNLRLDTREKMPIDLSWSFTSNPILIKMWKEEGRETFPKKIAQLERIKDIDKRLERREKENKIIYKTGYYLLRLKQKISNLFTRPNHKTDHSISLSQISSFEEKINQFWDKIKKEYNFIAERKQEYLNWRYCDLRGGKYIVKIAEDATQILGYYVIRINKKSPQHHEGFVVDFLTLSNRIDIAETMLEDIIKIFDENEVNSTFYWVVKDHPNDSLFRKHGFIETRNQLFIDFLKVNIGEEWNIFQASESDRLMFQYGDTDWI